MGRDNLEIKHIAVLVPTFTKRPQLGGRRGAPFILLVIFIHTHMQADQYLDPKQGTSLTLLVHYLFFFFF